MIGEHPTCAVSALALDRLVSCCIVDIDVVSSLSLLGLVTERSALAVDEAGPMGRHACPWAMVCGPWVLNYVYRGGEWTLS